MKTIKIKYSNEIPKDYTGIVIWDDGDKTWYRNRKFHREDGPAYTGKKGYKSWYLNNKFIWDSDDKLDLTNEILLSKENHSEYPNIQVWKILDKNGLREQIIIPGMEEFIKE